MKNLKLKQTVREILNIVDVKINGSRSWDIQVHDDKFYKRVLAYGSLGLGESYMDGWWDCDRLDEFFYRVLSVDLGEKINKRNLLWNILKAKLLNAQSKSRAFEVGEKHYDIGNELYKNMLDKRMVYTCGYWRRAKNLDKAQEDKLDLVCRKVGLKKGMKVLDIGCGWGSFAKYAAEKYGVKVIGITISKEQVKLARKLCNGLDVEIRLQDYRDVNEKFDAIISLGMFEHVGLKNYKTYMEKVSECLKKDGLFLLHTIGGNGLIGSNPWMNKYIFPNGSLPSAKHIINVSDKIFVMEDWHSFGADYDKTLMVWYNNFNKNWNKIKNNYDEKFRRMWKYYLLSCAGGFRTGKYLYLWQIVFSKNGIKKGYVSIR